MMLSNVKNYKNGWFVGDFDPAVFKTKNCEVGIHEYKKGFIGKDHFHLLSKEYNFIISGKLIANGTELNKGDIFIFSESEISSTEFLEDTLLLIVRDSSNKKDKYMSYAQFNLDARILNTYFNTFRTFNKYHHLFVLTVLFFHKHLNMDISNYSGMHEFSTILLCLIDMKLITKNIFNLLFPISFIMCRIIVFNLCVLHYMYYNPNEINTFTYIILILLNTMNFSIVIKMKLINKIWNLCKLL